MNWKPIVQYACLTSLNTAQIYITQSIMLSSFLIILTWMFYIELAVGGILIRPDHNNVNRFTIYGLIQQLKWPFEDYRAWQIDFLDLNFYTVVIGSIVQILIMKVYTG